GGDGIVLEASLAGPFDGDLSAQLALADEPRREGAKEGDAPRREGVARDGDKPRTGPRDGEVKKDGPRDGDAPRREGAKEGDAPRREGAPREGERRVEGAREGERPNPLAGFKPQTDREELLYQMIMQLQ